VYGRAQVLRALKVSGVFAALLLAGCSSGVERLTSASFGSGYHPQPGQQPVQRASAAREGSPNADLYAALGASNPAPRTTQSTGGEPSAGYLSVARVELAPLDDGQPARLQTADGYGRYNRGALRDGHYEGPRVRSPYDRANGRDRIVVPPDEELVIEGGRNGRVYRPSSNGRGGSYGGYGSGPRDANGPRNGHDPRDAYGAGAKDGEPEYGNGRGGPHPFERRGRHEFGDAHPGKAGGKVVKVEHGDTLHAIAIRYGTTVHALKDANGLYDSLIRVGQELIIPNGGPVTYAATVSSRGREADPREAGCPRGATCHVVKRGESLGSIAKAYDVPAIVIQEANGLRSPRDVRAGVTLYIPEQDSAPRRGASAGDQRTRHAARTETPAGRRPATARDEAVGSAHSQDGLTAAAPREQGPADTADTGERAASSAPVSAQVAALAPQAAPPVHQAGAEPNCDAALANPLPRTGSTFRQPVEGLITTKFGPKPDGGVSDGIALSVPKGTPVKAAENGVVAYVGDELAGYGNLVLIRHADDYVTAYGHLEGVEVRRCDVVKRGQVIARAGATGDVTQPQLHFEIRRASKPVDPAAHF
jgi:murein DD-endopeptidase MepM/ murein hydrolase activator NlpD